MSFAHISNLLQTNILLPVNDNQVKWDIAEVRRLLPQPGKKIIVRALQTYFNTEIPQDINGNDTLNENALRTGFLVLSNSQEQVLSELPLQNLVASQYNGRRFEVTYDNVDWSRSYIQFGVIGNLPAAGAEETVLITVYYEMIPEAV